MLCQISTKSLQHQETTKERQQNSVDLLTISMKKVFFVIAICIKSFIVVDEDINGSTRHRFHIFIVLYQLNIEK